VDQLLNQDPWGWSAVSVYRADRAFVIYNPRKSAGRRASDIMHELAHLILSHQPATVVMSQDGSFVMRSYDQAQEDEANWLAWCILLPREALLRCRKLDLCVAEIAEAHDVTETLVNFRLRMTGVESQLRAASARRKCRCPTKQPLTTTASRNQDPAVYFSSAASPRSRGVMWPSIAPALSVSELFSSGNSV
jgi:Zn-dependent peptidase ImmA (M78 family)